MDVIWGRYSALFYCGLGAVACALMALSSPGLWIPAALLGALCGLGLRDYLQGQHPVLGNYPLLGRFRYLFESIRPEIRQYFFEDDRDQLPYSRNQRAMVYQRARQQIAVRPFGSVGDMYREDHEWLNHSIQPAPLGSPDFRVSVGAGPRACSLSVLNASGTSFGALSPRRYSPSIPGPASAVSPTTPAKAASRLTTLRAVAI